MQNRFIQYVNQHKLFSKEQTILVAVSGGVDSVVLLHLLVNSGYKVTLAHCNFNLRDNESDSDEAFVRKLASSYKIQAHFIDFNTQKFAKENKLSIEMSARKLRYNWFNELLINNNYNFLATGHHLNDSIETIFLNLARGTGYKGIIGISKKNINIVRPLLFATRTEIESYAKENDIEYRNDSSNEEEKYLRNIVRKQIIPAFKKLNPAFEQVMKNNITSLNDASLILDSYFEDYKQEAISGNSYPIEIDFRTILAKTPKSIHLFELISNYGFNRDAVEKILSGINKEPGKLFYSSTHTLLIDREKLIITEKTKTENKEFQAYSLNELNKLPIELVAMEVPASKFAIIKKSNFACIDVDKISYPLTLRKWKNGDHFHPLGMSQKKKVSDFLIDTKTNLIEKENTWVLLSENEIVWIVNKRINNRFKITNETNKVLVIECK